MTPATERERLLERARGPAGERWDVVVVGGGATGLGTALDAVCRGYRTLLLEQHDFAKGTSSRSTKLVHGGVRYLQQGHVPLVLEALRERHRLLENAPHLVRELPFVVPTYRWWEGPFYGTGLRLYDLLARVSGQRDVEGSTWLSRGETLHRLPTVRRGGLRGGILYHDAQFDDARLAVTLVQTILDRGGVALNYLRVTGLLKEDGRVAGVEARDEESGERHRFPAAAVINATGVFADGVRRMDDPEARSVLAPSQGTHLVLPGEFLPGETALLVPRTRDGRVLFAIPWHGRVLAGTTDTAVDDVSLEPRPLPSEIRYVLDHLSDALERAPAPDDILSAFAGLRPLAVPPTEAGTSEGQEESTAEISRDDLELVSPSGLVTVVGGKWTTFREMGQAAVDRAIEATGLEPRPSATADLHLHGWMQAPDPGEPWRAYGTDASRLWRMGRERPELHRRLHPSLPYRAVQVVWAGRHEMARTVEDVLARRLRALILDAEASIQMAPRVAEILARELGRSEAWAAEQVSTYSTLAERYTVNPADLGADAA